MSRFKANGHGAWKRRRNTRAIPASMPDDTLRVAHDSVDVTRLGLDKRLRIIEDFVAAHPGRSVTAILLDLFPELLSIEAGRRHEP